MNNCLILSGIVCRTPVYRTSPLGIPHCQFILEHHSIQEEADCYRKAWCQIPVIISGNKHQDTARNIIVDSRITVWGFINYHKTQNGLGKMVLHANKIELKNFGD